MSTWRRRSRTCRPRQRAWPPSRTAVRPRRPGRRRARSGSLYLPGKAPGTGNGGRVSRLDWDWPAVRAAVDARMSELRLSTAELARRARMSETTIRAFRQGRSRPYVFNDHQPQRGPRAAQGLPARDRRGTTARPASTTTAARLARLEEKVDHLISLARNTFPEP